MIYVIAEATEGPCKIGVAVDVRRRLAALQGGNPRKLSVAHTHPSLPDIAPDAVIERLAHGILYKKKLESEWFGVTVGEAIAAIAQAVVTARDLTADLHWAPKVAALKPLPDSLADVVRLHHPLARR